VRAGEDHFTRSRSGNSNDGAHVEQKNWAIVRTVVGYHRYDTPAELVLLNQIWALQSLMTNYFSKARSHPGLAQGHMHAVIAPIALDGSILIRKFAVDHFTDRDLIAFGTMSVQVRDFLEACVRGRRNIVISDGTQAGSNRGSWSGRPTPRVCSAPGSYVPARPSTNQSRSPGEGGLGLDCCGRLPSGDPGARAMTADWTRVPTTCWGAPSEPLSGLLRPSATGRVTGSVKDVRRLRALLGRQPRLGGAPTWMRSAGYRRQPSSGHVETLRTSTLGPSLG